MHAAEIVGSDRDPLLFMIEKVFDESTDPQLRYNYAREAVKYLHPTLSATQVNAQHVVTHVDAGALLTRVAAQIAKQAVIEHELVEPADAPAETAE